MTVSQRWVRAVIRWRLPVLIGTLLLTMGLVTGARHLTLSTNYRVFFGKDNPDLLAFEEIENVYTKNDNILFVIAPRDGSEVFTPRTLTAVKELTEEAWQIPHSTRVDSVTNFQHTWSQFDDLIVEDLVGVLPVSMEAVERAKSVSLAEPLLLGRLVARDGRATGINIRIQLPGVSQNEVPEAVAKARELRDEFKAEYPELDIRLTGLAMLNASFAETPMVDAPTVMPLMFGLLSLSLVGFLKSWRGAGATLALVSMSAMSAVGVLGYLGVSFDPTSAAAPTIIMTLAIADGLHILVTYFKALRGGADRNTAILDSYRVNARPVFLTSLTTIVGFLSLNFSDSPPFHLLGNATAVGVFFAWFYCMTFLPALLATVPIVGSGEPAWVRRVVSSMSDLVTRRYRSVAIILGTICLVLVSSLSLLHINDRYHEYFSPKIDFRTSTDFALDRLTGIYNSSYSLESGRSNGVSDPQYLATVEAFTSWLRQRPEVAHVSSFSDTMKRLNQNLHSDDPNFHRLPEAADLAAQYLLLYEMSLPYGLDVNDQINVDKSALRIDITYGDVDLATVIASGKASDQWLKEHGHSDKAAGATLMFANITERNIASMLVGTGAGFLMIALILGIALRSAKMGLISLVPNILPSAMAFGLWALTAGEVGFAVSVVAGLAIGIIVDDTVHFLSKYQHAREQGQAPIEAVSYSFENVGVAIVGTSIVLSAGFAMLGLSTFRVTAYMGLLTSLSIICAFITDLFLLPALLLLLDKEN